MSIPWKFQSTVVAANSTRHFWETIVTLGSSVRLAPQITRAGVFVVSPASSASPTLAMEQRRNIRTPKEGRSLQLPYGVLSLREQDGAAVAFSKRQTPAGKHGGTPTVEPAAAPRSYTDQTPKLWGLAGAEWFLNDRGLCPELITTATLAAWLVCLR
ncbi:hypothetical protein HPB50_013108 [Hyalomma asiaticum]|uniref:Uncharacterized protein n=1 Tax=Hyalomma asiaticum TaxID=266040 RepID=A0ACB7S8U5_HYAAI|nr:hypothetical protein HPB50_013108 [Hyalomma asiaticum]